jgi:hypothetical protein
MNRGITIASICAVMLLTGAMTYPPLAVTNVRNLSFGTLYRGVTTTVNFDNANAGEFIIDGAPWSHVQIDVKATDCSMNNATLPIELSGNLCAVSLDEGASWIPFSSESLTQVVQFPKQSSPSQRGTTRVVVRIGGAITPRQGQQRGEYSGQITVTAEYLDDEEMQ